MRRKSKNPQREVVQKDEYRVNDEIRAASIRCIGPEGEQLGVITVEKALEIADEHNLDLVEVAAKSDPPVCRILDYGKFKFQKAKRDSGKKKQKGATLKEVKFRPKIDEHDFNFKRNHVERFLKSGAKVKVTIMFRGREMAHTEKGREILDRVGSEMEEIARVDREARLEGRNMFMILAPK